MTLPKSMPQREASEITLPERVRVEVRLGDSLMTFKLPNKLLTPLIAKWKKRKYLVKSVKVKKAKPNKISSSEPVELVKSYRAKKKLSQGQLAKRLDTTQATVSQIENGRRGISRDMARRLAKVIGVNYRNFL